MSVTIGHSSEWRCRAFEVDSSPSTFNIQQKTIVTVEIYNKFSPTAKRFTQTQTGFQNHENGEKDGWDSATFTLIRSWVTT
jgi:hypothetical protein